MRDRPCWYGTDTDTAVEVDVLFVSIGDIPTHASNARLANVTEWPEVGAVKMVAGPAVKNLRTKLVAADGTFFI